VPKVNNVATGEINIHVIPQGRYKIYYLRPVEKARVIKSAQMRLEKVGKGYEFNIWFLEKD